MKTVSSILVLFLTELMTENAFSPARNLSIKYLKLLLTIPAVSVPGLTLHIISVIDEHRWCCSYTDLAKNI